MELLVTAAELSSWDDVRLFAHPALLREEPQEEMRGALASVDQGRHRLAATLEFLAERRTDIEREPAAFEPGGGPIERVWVRWDGGRTR